MAEYISKEFMLKNLDEDMMNNAEHCEPVTVQIMERFIRYVKEFPAADVQPVKHGRWITKAEDYYKKWQDSGRSWDDMPYFVTGKHIACSECFTEYDVCTEGIEHWTGCPCCLARMDGDKE